MEALERYREGDFTLLLTDLHMPEMDGYDLTRRIREIEQQASQPRIPIITITANALKDEVERCKSIGMDGYLTKPIVLKDLQAELERWLKG